MKCQVCGGEGKAHCDNPACTWVRCAQCRTVTGRYSGGVRTITVNHQEGES